MNRRGFLGLLPGALVGGKAAAKEAAEKLALGGLGAVQPAPGGYGAPVAVPSDLDNISWATDRLKKLFDFREQERRRQQWVVTRLDPDLAVNVSMSLSAKMLIQKDRELARYYENERTYLEGIIAGLWS